MRRKIAFYCTAALTLALMIARLFTAAVPVIADVLIVVSVIAFAAIAILCFSKKAPVHEPHGSWYTVIGWITTFCGAVIAMSLVFDAFCWIVYGQIPPPTPYIINRTDHITLICTILFGFFASMFFIVRGFNWMSHSDKETSAVRWLSLTPVLWVWFRLARYEVSYASTIDITESFFDFALLVFVSLFFLSFARAISHVGPKQKNTLLVFSLCAGMIALSGAPVTFMKLASGEPLSTLLIAIVDVVVGVLAAAIAAMQVFAKPVKDTTVDDDMAWTSPAKETPTDEPPFDIDSLLPPIDSECPSTPADSDDTTVDDILRELGHNEFADQ